MNHDRSAEGTWLDRASMAAMELCDTLSFHKWTRDQFAQPKTLKGKILSWYFWSAAGAARKFFEPKNLYLPSVDARMERMNVMRNFSGASIVIAARAVGYGYPPGLLALITPPSFTDSWALMAIPCTFIVFAVVIGCATHRNHRRQAIRHMLYPLKTLTAAFGPLCLIFWPERNSITSYISNFWVKFLFDALEVATVVWFFVFMVCALQWCARGLFRAADGHPLLGPVTGVAMGIAGIGSIIIGNDSYGPMLPKMVALVIGSFGCLSVFYLSVWEICRLRKKYPGQFPFLDGPLVANRSYKARGPITWVRELFRGRIFCADRAFQDS